MHPYQVIQEQMETLYNLAAGKKLTIKDKDAIPCEKCGDETSRKLVEDEWYNICPSCEWVTNNEPKNG